MSITTLQIADFRNVSTASIAPCQVGLNVIHGANGSGKTSILEAIHYIGVGRSFRTSTANRLIQQTKDKFSIFAQLISETARHIPVGLERELSGTMRLRVAEKEVSTIAQMASYLPIRVIDSHSHDLYESGPQVRRKFLDWGLFYQSETFLTCWRQFERVLKQRNVLLRDKHPKSEIQPWTEELIRYSLELDQLRNAYVEDFLPVLEETANALLGLSGLQIDYLPGWNKQTDYADVLSHAFPEEHRYGYTLYGPHRADLEIKVDAVPVKHFLSRGQQKLLVCAMIIAQGKLLASKTNKAVIYLVDDLPAELDEHNRDKLISLLSAQPTQIFITAIEKETICDVVRKKNAIPLKVFHVEHGCVTEIPG